MTCRDRWPLARISDCLDAMNGSVYFGTIDLSQSFHQLPINDSRDLHEAAFITRKGQFRFTAMPMGSVNSTSVFSRLMCLVLKSLNWVKCLVYVDDTVILGLSLIHI